MIGKEIKKLQLKLHALGHKVETEKWQGVEAPMPMIELVNANLKVLMESQDLRADVKPHLPWADIHFLERVGGEPLNPGESYKEWPFYKHKKEDDKFRGAKDEKFSHTYMERFWPKTANAYHSEGKELPISRGIRYKLGDLDDLIALLNEQPYTRQAYLPIWFPEDLAASLLHHRVPCTLGYDFIIREGYLHMNYYMRSCDALRHFRDDVYLAIQLAKFIQARVDSVKGLKLGLLTMSIKSFHCFWNERDSLLSKSF